jgi:hypothetical protein
MERNGRRSAAPVVRLRALVPLTSREEDRRYWYDPGNRETGSHAGGAGRSYGLGCLDRNAEGIDISWSGVDRRTGH